MQRVIFRAVQAVGVVLPDGTQGMATSSSFILEILSGMDDDEMLLLLKAASAVDAT